MKQNWEKEFDKLLSECVFGNGDDTNLKVFISKLIRQAEKEEKEKNEKETTGWHHANDFNSTKFTNCCGCASNVGERCPECGKRVE